MRSSTSSPTSVLLSAALLLLSTALVQERAFCGFDKIVDFQETKSFDVETLFQERICRPPSELPRGITKALPLSPPPAIPYTNFVLDMVVVLQRHGCRRSLFSTVPSPAYGNTKPGQLLPQGAYELHVAGIETRRYLMYMLGLKSNAERSLRFIPDFPKNAYKGTVGSDLTEECRFAGMSWASCTPSTLVRHIAQLLPADAVYARCSSLPRTMWSGLMFLEGFYGLPFACAITVDELEKTMGGRVKDVCMRRSACDTPEKDLPLGEATLEKCASRLLPCVHTIPLARDGLMCGATLSIDAHAEAEKYYKSKGVLRTYAPQDLKLQAAFWIATSIWGEHLLGKDPWAAGEMGFSERAAGDETPLAPLATWVKEQKALCAIAGTCKQEDVRTYESLIADLFRSFSEASKVQYGDGMFSRYVVSPAVALQNALFRVKAFGRTGDWQHLLEILYLEGGFERLMKKQAVENLKLLLISYHDFLLHGWRELLGIYDDELLPFAARLTFELSHAETETPPQGADSDHSEGREKSSEDDICGSGADGESQPYSPDRCSWPKTPHFVRVLLGGPEKKLEPVPLPWCGNTLVCPLDEWLAYTYKQVKGHWFYDVVSSFKQKYAEARRAGLKSAA